MPAPVTGPCGGQGEPACPPVSAVIKALSDLLWAIESGNPIREHLAAAHAIVDPFRPLPTRKVEDTNAA